MAISGSPSKSSAIKERVFKSTASLDMMRKWRQLDGSEALYHYLSNSARRAEVARRFGDNFSKWPEMEAKIRKEGGQAIVDQLKKFVMDTTGLRRREFGSSDNAVSFVRTAMTLGSLEKAVLPNLMEAVSPLAATNGNFRAAVATLRTNIDAMATWVSRMPPSQRRQSVDELSKYLGYVSDIVAREQSVARYSGAAPIKSAEGKWLHQFFERNQMNRLTDALRRNTTDIGAVYMDSLSKSITGEGFLGSWFKNTAQRSLNDLGVPKGQEAAFAKYVTSLKNMIPSPTQLQKDGAMS